MKTPITDAQRNAWRHAPDVRFEVPPVCCALWTEDDWIRWVDWTKHGNDVVLRRYES